MTRRCCSHGLVKTTPDNLIGPGGHVIHQNLQFWNIVGKKGQCVTRLEIQSTRQQCATRLEKEHYPPECVARLEIESAPVTYTVECVHKSSNPGQYCAISIQACVAISANHV